MRPLAVDLDGTLIKTDLLQETASDFATSKPLRLPQMLLWLLSGGRARLKARLAAHCAIDAAALPWNQEVLSWLKQEKERGRHLALATASHGLLAEQVQQHLQLFDKVLATDDNTNLRQEQKRCALVAEYGERGFDYIGNSRDDLAVWSSAGGAYVVSDSAKLVERARGVCQVEKTFASGRPPAWRSILHTIRPHQWAKNLLLLAPLMTSHSYGDLQSWLHAVAAFAVFCLASSGIYVLNDLADCSRDRRHHAKRRRPFAAGDLSLASGWALWPLLLLGAIGIAAALLPAAFISALLSYMLLAMGYSMLLKKLAIIDVLTLALLYTIRVAAGAAAISTQLSFWLLVFSMFIFMSLALVKRYSELHQQASDDDYGKSSGRGYRRDDLEAISTMGIGSGLLSVLVLMFYIENSGTAMTYQSPEFIWLACPVLAYWTLRMWLLTHRGQMHHDPVAFAIGDMNSWICGGLFVTAFAAARFVQ